MPTYEYICKRCGERLEVFQSFAEKPLRTHKECEGDLQKVFHARGVVFKGSGFYSTDSRAAASTANSKKPEPAKSGSSKTADSTKKAESSPKAGSSTSSD